MFVTPNGRDACAGTDSATLTVLTAYQDCFGLQHCFDRQNYAPKEFPDIPPDMHGRMRAAS